MSLVYGPPIRDEAVVGPAVEGRQASAPLELGKDATSDDPPAAATQCVEEPQRSFSGLATVSTKLLRFAKCPSKCLMLHSRPETPAYNGDGYCVWEMQPGAYVG
ncbi:Aste57867_24947 [Aphanomyces stellatus]|uniref:Aste57867_24947 protein n=1 Tax=Aphanomyces stellatus TaxID=120398 RepID=A0A485LTX5_9STRA|nr:hypothetical protein As57867_024869 [Aphanomyces stellatus]VFU01578.1 Aste57867_24947 [Aphanomyces stellatus]